MHITGVGPNDGTDTMLIPDMAVVGPRVVQKHDYLKRGRDVRSLSDEAPRGEPFFELLRTGAA